MIERMTQWGSWVAVVGICRWSKSYLIDHLTTTRYFGEIEKPQITHKSVWNHWGRQKIQWECQDINFMSEWWSMGFSQLFLVSISAESLRIQRFHGEDCNWFESTYYHSGTLRDPAFVRSRFPWEIVQYERPPHGKLTLRPCDIEWNCYLGCTFSDTTHFTFTALARSRISFEASPQFLSAWNRLKWIDFNINGYWMEKPTVTVSG